MRPYLNNWAYRIWTFFIHARLLPSPTYHLWHKTESAIGWYHMQTIGRADYIVIYGICYQIIKLNLRKETCMVSVSHFLILLLSIVLSLLLKFLNLTWPFSCLCVFDVRSNGPMIIQNHYLRHNWTTKMASHRFSLKIIQKKNNFFLLNLKRFKNRIRFDFLFLLNACYFLFSVIFLVTNKYSDLSWVVLQINYFKEELVSYQCYVMNHE